MAIYSLHHSHIGKATQERPQTAAAHLRYITRESAAGAIVSERMPAKPKEAQAWISAAENSDRKNGRVLDKLMLALPRELTDEQRLALIRRFAERVTEGRASWLAAVHDRNKDEQNPHCHLVLRDRDAATGKRVFQTSEKGSTERLRSLWEEAANEALAEAGQDVRIDRRTLEAQGIIREPTIHEGPKSREMDKRGARHQSQARVQRNAPGSRRPSRTVHYPNIDRGLSRPEFNRRLAPQRENELWAEVDHAVVDEGIEAQRAIHKPGPDGLREARRAWLARKSSRVVQELEQEDEREPDF